MDFFNFGDHMCCRFNSAVVGEGAREALVLCVCLDLHLGPVSTRRF